MILQAREVINMTRIAKISLDIRKDNIIDNDPIILRQGDSDVTIEASISNDGYPDIEIEFATFVAKKSDGTIISNDPTNVSGNVISYPISKHLTESVGKIQDAYFMINNQITTCGFDISITTALLFSFFKHCFSISIILTFNETCCFCYRTTLHLLVQLQIGCFIPVVCLA